MSTSFGALPVSGGVRFRVWAPAIRELALILHDGQAEGIHVPGRDDAGVHDLIVDGAAAGDRYSYRLDTGDLRPDPASRFQPDGVHGPSQIVDPSAFQWTDRRWGGRPACDHVVYELHVGTFTPAGTFAGVTDRLPYLRDLGVSVVELMPVADFAGSRNWGYDGVCLYAPSRAYGRPDDLRALVDAAHRCGIAIMLDVVYNHLGPEGAYLSAFASQYLTDRHTTPWGHAVNLDGPGSEMVRRFIIESAAHWIREYHMDGLRLDATHALVDDSDQHLVRELARVAHGAAVRPITIHAEDHRNLATMIDASGSGGWDLDGVWADDFHHAMRRLLAGDSHSYYADFAGAASEVARIIQHGWLYSGQRSRHTGEHRGTDASAIPMRRFVICLQNHDQIGNRAMGDRLHHGVGAEVWRAASTLLLTAPMTPLLFMGQEWAAGTPFQYFTDLEPELGRLVTDGRRREFADFPEFSREDARARIPDPQAPSTFDSSRLRWEEIGASGHAAVLALYRALIALRLDHAALGASDERAGVAFAPDQRSLVMRRTDGDATFWIVARLQGEGTVDLASDPVRVDAHGATRWEVLLTTEEPLFSADPVPPEIDLAPQGPAIRFQRPGAVVLRQG